MSDVLPVTQLRQTAHETREWLDDLAGRPPFENHAQAYSFLRAVLHAVRDRLTVEEVAHLASQFPMLVRGFYYEGWRPTLAPNEFETVDAFLDRVGESLGGAPGAPGPDARAAVEAVLALLVERIDEGQMTHVIQQLPGELTSLFPASVQA